MVSGNDDDEQITTLQDLYRRSKLPDIPQLEVEEENEEPASSAVMIKIETLLIGIVGSLVASMIWRAVSGV